MVKTYFLFGSAAVKHFLEYGIEDLLEEGNEALEEGAVFEFTKGVTEASELLDAVDGWDAFCNISEFDFNAIIETFPELLVSPKSTKLSSTLVGKKEIMCLLIEIREDLIKRDAVSRDGEYGKACTLFRDWIYSFREELEIPWSELGQTVLDHLGLELEYIYPSAEPNTWKREGNIIFDSKDEIVFGLTRKGDAKNPPLSFEFLDEIIYKHNFEGISIYTIEEMINKKSKEYTPKIIEDAIEQFYQYDDRILKAVGERKFN